jgi:flagellar basal body-associated protein FliL
MADKKPSETPAADAAPAKGGKKTLLMVAGLMVAEAALVGVGVMVFVKGPSQAGASELTGAEEADKEQPVEILLIEDRFQNMQSGRVWGWQAEIYLKVRQRNMDTVKKVQERDAAEIKEGVALIFRRAQDRFLREPGLETLSRQLTTYVHQVFGTDRDGMAIVDRVIISKLKGTPEDI